MASLLRTGAKLETSMGSPEFACMVVSLLGLSQGFTLLLSKGLLSLGNDIAYYQYSAGFSGVLLGMNVVLNAREGDVVWHGVTVPAKYAALLELLFIHAFNPEAHLICNVGGILAGLAYLLLRHGPERLAPMFSDIAYAVSQPARFAKKLLRSAAHGRGSSVRHHVAPAQEEVGQALRTRTMPFPADGISKTVETTSSQSRRSAIGGSKDLEDDVVCTNAMSIGK
ncbi:unnamed protein product [Triticum turgidum subsp. durum]|uniref:Peptidase S54 rhomboid domain-containing protein n=1 Tax=Triticum turgidum subsp. durum TaxID=4567 RepID=A0A9R1QEJ1_TRITD|nr:unnamed protein product [Triticum turgidum subsp. durum]